MTSRAIILPFLASCEIENQYHDANKDSNDNEIYQLHTITSYLLLFYVGNLSLATTKARIRFERR